MQKPIEKTRIICGYAINLALLTVCSQIAIPLPFTAVPVTLATFMIFVTGGLLGPKRGMVCVGIYILMGLIGLPVFAGFKSLSALVGPTGGYIMGYIPMVAIVGLFRRRFSAPILHFAGMAIGLLILYAFGTAWFCVITGAGVGAALLATVTPFIAADVFKMVLAYLVTARLDKVI